MRKKKGWPYSFYRMHKKISFISLVLLIVASIDSIRNLPTAALFGAHLIFFFLLAAIIFLFPASLAAAELSAMFPEEGGIYHWVTKAFNEKIGMLAIWLQWINTMVWYPTILSFIAATFAYLICPELANNKFYLVGFVLVLFWGLTLINLFGLHASTKINGYCALFGTVFPLTLIIVLTAFWVYQGNPLQISFSLDKIIPSLDSPSHWVSLVAIMASFLGIELAGVHVDSIKNPQKNFPRALFVSCLFILFSMLFGSLAIALVTPVKEINLVAGIMQVFTTFFSFFGMKWAIPILTLLIVLGTTGSIINWLISPAKGLLHASKYGFLPPFFAKVNRYGVAYRILIAQALLVSVFCLLVFLVPTVNAFYWFLTTLSTELYMVMYLLMFAALLRVRYKYKLPLKTFRIPGKHLGVWIVGLLGLFGSLLTIFVGFFPPSHIEIASPLKYATMIGAGNLLMIAPVYLFYLYKSHTQIIKLHKK